MASAGGLGGADTAGPASVRQLAATAILTMALWGARLVGVVRWYKGTQRAGCGRSRTGLSAGRDAVARASLVQYARSGRVQCTHGRCSTQCRGVLQVTGEVGKQQN